MRDCRCVLGELFLVWIVDISPDTLGVNCTNGINIQKAAEKWVCRMENRHRGEGSLW
jgi:hypothetical protein